MTFKFQIVVTPCLYFLHGIKNPKAKRLCLCMATLSRIAIHFFVYLRHLLPSQISFRELKFSVTSPLAPHTPLTNTFVHLDSQQKQIKLIYFHIIFKSGASAYIYIYSAARSQWQYCCPTEGGSWVQSPGWAWGLSMWSLHVSSHSSKKHTCWAVFGS